MKNDPLVDVLISEGILNSPVRVFLEALRSMSGRSLANAGACTPWCEFFCSTKDNTLRAFDLVGSVPATVLCHRGSSLMPLAQAGFSVFGKIKSRAVEGSCES